jgi:hypothetical protein
MYAVGYSGVDYSEYVRTQGTCLYRDLKVIPEVLATARSNKCVDRVSKGKFKDLPGLFNENVCTP